MSMREDEILEKLRQDVQIPERVQQKAEEAFASIKRMPGKGTTRRVWL